MTERRKERERKPLPVVRIEKKERPQEVESRVKKRQKDKIKAAFSCFCAK